MGTANGDGRDPMGEWPEGWFRDGKDSADGSAADDAGGLGADRTVSIPSSQHPGGQYRAGQYAADPSGYGAAAQRPVPPAGSWPQQPPVNSSGSGADYSAGGSYGADLAAPARSPARPGGPSLPGAPRWRRWLRPRRIFSVLAVIVALLLVAGVGTYFYLNSKLTRSNILVGYSGRPSPGVRDELADRRVRQPPGTD